MAFNSEGRSAAQMATRALCRRWWAAYPRMVRQLERDVPELLAFFRLPRHLWRKLHTTNIIEHCFVEVRRRTRPVVCFVNVQSVERIIYSIFQRFNLDGKPAPSEFLHKHLDVTKKNQVCRNP